MRRIHAGLAIAALALTVAVPVGAELGPRLASDLVALRVNDGLPCPNSPGRIKIEARENSDGTLTTWDGPPPGKVLIINHVRLYKAGTPGSVLKLVLVTPLAVVIGDAVVDALGWAELDVTLPTGFAVKPGTVLCTEGTADVFGYLAADR